MESYKTSWYSEEPLDLSMKVNDRPKKLSQSSDSPLCMVKSCACALSVNDKQKDSILSDTTLDESSSDANSKGRNLEYSVTDKSETMTKEGLQIVYSKKSLTPPSPYRRDVLLGLESRSPRGESPQVGRSTPQHYLQENSSSPSTVSQCPFPPGSSYQSFKGGKYDVVKQSGMPSSEWQYSDTPQYDRESSARDQHYYNRNMSSPRAVKHEYESSSFADRGVSKLYRLGGSGGEDEKTTFICMDTGKYYENSSMRYRGTSSLTKQVTSPRDKAPVSKSPNSEIRSNFVGKETKRPEENILYSSLGAVVYNEGGSADHTDRHVSERRTMSNTVKYSADDVQDPAHLKQKENAFWCPVSGVCYKQYQTSLKRQFVPHGSDFSTDECEGSKRFCDQSDKNGCQNWLVDEFKRATSKQDQYQKTQTSQKNSDDSIPKFEIVPLTAATETKLSWSRGSTPFVVSKMNISGMESNAEDQNEDDLMIESNKDLDGKQKDSQGPVEHTNRKMCALDYLISKVLVERIDVPFKACNSEIKRIYRGECKGRLRLVDLIELQVEASLKV